MISKIRFGKKKLQRRNSLMRERERERERNNFEFLKRKSFD